MKKKLQEGEFLIGWFISEQPMKKRRKEGEFLIDWLVSEQPVKERLQEGMDYRITANEKRCQEC